MGIFVRLKTWRLISIGGRERERDGGECEREPSSPSLIGSAVGLEDDRKRERERERERERGRWGEKRGPLSPLDQLGATPLPSSI